VSANEIYSSAFATLFTDIAKMNKTLKSKQVDGTDFKFTNWTKQNKTYSANNEEHLWFI